MAAQTYQNASLEGVDLNPKPFGSNQDKLKMDFDGMTQSQAREILILAMNKLRQAKNAYRVRIYKEAVEEWHDASKVNDGVPGKILPFPKMAPLVKTLNSRQLDQAVFQARQRGGFEELLEKAGFRAKK